jgi:hypothetical protein
VRRQPASSASLRKLKGLKTDAVAQAAAQTGMARSSILAQIIQRPDKPRSYGRS